MKASVNNIAKTLYEMIKDLPIGEEGKIKIDVSSYYGTKTV